MKDSQRTLKKPVRIIGTEAFGGNKVNVTLHPAAPNTGIEFKLPTGIIPANINYAQTSGPFNFTFLLKNGDAELLCSEHILATTYATGIDNVQIQIDKIPSRNFKTLEKLGWSTKRQAVPYFPPNNERALYHAIQQTGLVEQNAPRKILRLEEEIGNERLSIKPIDSDELILTAKTDYKKIGKQKTTLVITPKNYEKISKARAYMKLIPHWASEKVGKFLGGFVMYPHHGLKSGMSSELNFRQTRTAEQWKAQERMPSEVACHTIIDKLGALALIPGRLKGVHVISKYSNHKNDIKILKENQYKFKQQ